MGKHIFYTTPQYKDLKNVQPLSLNLEIKISPRKLNIYQYDCIKLEVELVSNT